MKGLLKGRARKLGSRLEIVTEFIYNTHGLSESGGTTVEEKEAF